MATDTNLMTTEELCDIIDDLDMSFDTVPREAIERAREHKECITPALIAEISDACRTIRQGATVEGQAPLLSMVLLAEFEAFEALPAILELLSLPEEAVRDLIGPALEDVVPRVLASLGGDQSELLERLAGVPALTPEVRMAAQRAMVLLVRDGKLSREAVIRRLSTQLSHQIQERLPQSQCTVLLLCHLGAGEARDVIARAFDEELVDLSFCSRESAAGILEAGKAAMAEYLAALPPTRIADTAEVARAWLAEEAVPQPAVPQAEEGRLHFDLKYFGPVDIHPASAR
jgi:Protein of unknown function (DUF1186)